MVFFQFDDDAASDHIGIIEKDNGDTIITIEGNTSTSSDHNGGTVMRRTRKKSLIMAVARPKYSEEVETVTVELSVLKKGSRGGEVKALQHLLIGSGFGCGASGADGVFGNDTVKAVKAYQSKSGLAADAVVGQKTWSKLLGR